jgi:hypothetical protein
VLELVSSDLALTACRCGSSSTPISKRAAGPTSTPSRCASGSYGPAASLTDILLREKPSRRKKVLPSRRTRPLPPAAGPPGFQARTLSG